MFFFVFHLIGYTFSYMTPGKVMAAVYVVNIISRAMCSKWINIIGLNLCLDFKKSIFVPYVLLRTSHFKHRLVSWDTHCCQETLLLKSAC